MSQMQNNLDEIENISYPSWQIEQIMIFFLFYVWQNKMVKT